MDIKISITTIPSTPSPEISDVGALIASNYSFWLSHILIFGIGYLISHSILFRKFDVNLRHEVSSSIMSATHGMGCLLTAILILALPGTLVSPNTVTQDLLLQFSTSYFLVDFIHSLVFFNGEYIFLLHHLASLYVLLSCTFVVKCGAYGLIKFLALAESTCICQNMWHTVGLVKDEYLWARIVFDFMSPRYFSLYLIVRGVIGPVFLFELGTFYFNGQADGLIPMWARVSWVLAILFGIIVSVIWVLRKWCGWIHTRLDKGSKKLC